MTTAPCSRNRRTLVGSEKGQHLTLPGVAPTMIAASTFARILSLFPHYSIEKCALSPQLSSFTEPEKEDLSTGKPPETLQGRGHLHSAERKKLSRRKFPW
jgi:hypothetical protein